MFTTSTPIRITATTTILLLLLEFEVWLELHVIPSALLWWSFVASALVALQSGIERFTHSALIRKHTLCAWSFQVSDVR